MTFPVPAALYRRLLAYVDRVRPHRDRPWRTDINARLRALLKEEPTRDRSTTTPR